jgi:hypothetical protein
MKQLLMHGYSLAVHAFFWALQKPASFLEFVLHNSVFILQLLTHEWHYRSLFTFLSGIGEETSLGGLRYSSLPLQLQVQTSS